MTKQEILSKLIEHYKWCIENMPEEGWEEFLCENNVQHGICWCSEHKFDFIIGSKKWVQRNTIFLFWCRVPFFTFCPTEAKQLLQKRVDIMEKEILIIE